MPKIIRNTVLLALYGRTHTLVSSRVYPHPHRYWLRPVTAAGEEKPAEEVPKSVMYSLTAAELIKPAPLDRQWDTIDFTLTDKGFKAVAAIPADKAKGAA